MKQTIVVMIFSYSWTKAWTPGLTAVIMLTTIVSETDM